MPYLAKVAEYEVATDDCTYHNIRPDAPRCNRWTALRGGIRVRPANPHYPFPHVVYVDGAGETNVHEVRVKPCH
jgi:hypothetical protein